jgi:hypothetical protein
VKTIFEYLPLIVIFFGALLVAVGGLWQGVRQRDSSKEATTITRQMADNLEYQSRMYATDEDRRFLVAQDARKMAEKSPPEKASILTDLEAARVRGEFAKKESEARAIRLARDFELTWGKYILFILQEFDRQIVEIEGEVDQTAPTPSQMPIAYPYKGGPVGELGIVRTRSERITFLYEAPRITSEEVGYARLVLVDSNNDMGELRLLTLTVNPSANPKMTLSFGKEEISPVVENGAYSDVAQQQLRLTIRSALRRFLVNNPKVSG